MATSKSRHGARGERSTGIIKHSSPPHSVRDSEIHCRQPSARPMDYAGDEICRQSMSAFVTMLDASICMKELAMEIRSGVNAATPQANAISNRLTKSERLARETRSNTVRGNTRSRLVISLRLSHHADNERRPPTVNARTGRHASIRRRDALLFRSEMALRAGAPGPEQPANAAPSLPR